MTQLLVKVSLGTFTHALNHARRRFPLVDANCIHDGALVIAIAKEKHHLFPPRPDFRRGDAQVPVAERDEARFYAKHCHLILAYPIGHKGAGEPLPVGGYCVLSGQLHAFWNVEKGKGDWMLQHAIKDGAKHLDHFDVPHLNDLYERHGFRVHLREPYDPRKATTPITGKPDIIFRRLA